MKFLLLTALLMANAFVCVFADVIRLSEPAAQDRTSETFGAPVDNWPDSIELAELLANSELYLGDIFSLRAEVSQVCQKKGCFFILQQAGKMIRVSFKNYDFFVPTDISGRKVTIVGELVRQNVSGAQAAHLSKDLGEKGSVQKGAQYQIVASTVKVDLP